MNLYRTALLVLIAALVVLLGLTAILVAPYLPGGPLTAVGGAIVLFILVLVLVVAGLKVVSEYYRLVIFRLGKCIGFRGPGVVYVLPVLERAIPVDMRERFKEVSHESCITKDNAQIDVDFLFYWKVVNPVWSQTRVQNLEASLEGLATGLLRAVIGLFPLDDALAQRERINEELKDKLEEVSEHWGVTVTTVEIREIVPPKDIQDAMHRQLAAERDRRAIELKAQGLRQSAILHAEGEAMALERLYRTAKEIDPKTLQLKYLQALTEVGRSNSTKYIFPMEFTQFIKPFIQANAAGESERTASNPIADLSSEEAVAILRKLLDLAGQEKRNAGKGNGHDQPAASSAEAQGARIIPPLDEAA